ncbi:MAG: hypothetical protein ABSC63_16540 [Candidatus Binataceae bacterium]|jgi:hypothetical protein
MAKLGVSSMTATTGLCAALAMLVIAATGFAQESPQNPAAKQTIRKQALWVANVANTPYFSIFQGTKLSRSGVVRPTFAFSDGSGFGNASAIAFDAKHNFWASFCAPSPGGVAIPGVIIELTAAHLRQLVEFGRTTHSVVLTFQNANDNFAHCPESLQFDQAGNLWVVTLGNYAGGKVQGPNLLEYTPSEIAQSGSPTPKTIVTITEPPLPPTDFSSNEIQFDAGGNLWVSGGIVRVSPVQEIVVDFTPAQLSAGGALASNLNIAVSNAVPIHYVYITTAFAFDKRGNLWVAYYTGGANVYQGGLKMFAAADLAGTGTIAPTPMVTIDLGNLTSPGALAFDDLGDLWVANAPELITGTSGGANIAEFTPDQLAASGAPTPKALLSDPLYGRNFSNPDVITFGPKVP